MSPERSFGKSQEDIVLDRAGENKPGTSTEEIIYKSPVMHEVEERFGKPIEEIVPELCDRQGMGICELAKALGIHRSTASAWVQASRHGFKEAKAAFASEGKVRKDRSTAARDSWADPQKKAARVAIIHSPEADKKRKDTMLRYYADHPEAGGATAKKIMQERMLEKLGKNLADMLKRMNHQYGFSVEDIALRIGESVSRVRNWMNKLGVPVKRPATKSAILSWKEDLKAVRQGMSAGVFDYLNPNQQNVLRQLFYNRNGNQIVTIEDIAEMRNVSAQNISQMAKRALSNLRKRMLQTEEIPQKTEIEVNQGLLEELGKMDKGGQFELKRCATAIADKLTWQH